MDVVSYICGLLLKRHPYVSLTVLAGMVFGLSILAGIRWAENERFKSIEKGLRKCDDIYGPGIADRYKEMR